MYKKNQFYLLTQGQRKKLCLFKIKEPGKLVARYKINDKKRKSFPFQQQAVTESNC